MVTVVAAVTFLAEVAAVGRAALKVVVVFFTNVVGLEVRVEVGLGGTGAFVVANGTAGFGGRLVVLGAALTIGLGDAGAAFLSGDNLVGRVGLTSVLLSAGGRLYGGN